MSPIEDAPGGQRRRRARRAGRANSDSERRALAKARSRPSKRAQVKTRPGFTALTVDGGARESPPMAAIGYVLEAADGSLLDSHAERIGVATAIVAEYQALLAGLRRAHALGLRRVQARSDSRVVVAHLAGERKPGNPKLIELGDEIVDMTERIGSVTVTWIPSDANGTAHSLVGGALRGRAGAGGAERDQRRRRQRDCGSWNRG